MLTIRDIPPETLKRLGYTPRTRSKYNAKRVVVDGIKFDSQKEADRYSSLKIRPDVARFFRQVQFDLPGGVVYRLDFLVFWTDGKVTYEDVKGFRTPVYRLKKKQAEAIYGVTITEI